MRGLLRCLRVDLRRAVCSLRFLVAVAGFAVLLDLNLPPDPWPREAPYLFSLTYKYGFYCFFLVCAAIPHAGSWLADLEGGYVKCLVRRVPLGICSLSRCFAVLLSGALAVLAGTALFVGDLYLCFPASAGVSVSYSGWDALLGQGSVWQYILTKTLLTALLGGNFAVLALLLSTVVRNSFVVLASPLLLFYFCNELSTLLPLPAWCFPTQMLYILPFADHMAGSLAFFAAEQLVVFTLSTLAFYAQMRRLRSRGYCS